MRIVCLVKQVPHPEAIEFDPETKALRREGVPLELNPFDREAVRQAVRLRDRAGGEVVALTMGPPQAEEALREALALGADRAVHLSDRTFAVADTIGTARTLGLAVAKLGADLVVCGRKTVDSETWQVPPEVAAFLGWPVLIAAVALAPAGDGLRVERESDEGAEIYEVALPAVVSVARADGEHVAPAPAAGRVALWTAADLVADAVPEDKRFGQRGSPTRVLAVRDVSPVRAGQLARSIEEALARVDALLAERPREQPTWEKPAHIAEQPGAHYDSWALVELFDGRPLRVSLELVGRSRALAGKLGGENVALLLGHELDGAAEEVVAHGAERVVLVDHPTLARYHPERWAVALRHVLELQRPHVLLLPATARSREYGPLVAGQLELGMTGDCVAVDVVKAGRLLQTKPAYGGRIVSVVMGRTTPQLATVRQRMYEPLERRDGATAEVVRLGPPAFGEPRSRLTEATLSPAHDLDAAKVVVLAGAGVPPELATSGAAGVAVAGTREACAAGVLPWTRHVGLFGRPVAPRVLVALGVAGDFEHLTGFVRADVVLAADTRAGSPMLAAADVGVVTTPEELLPRLAELALRA